MRRCAELNAERSRIEAAPTVSLIVPALNEAATLPAMLARLQGWRGFGCEIIVVDGGSRDGTVAAVEDLADSVIRAPQGRARQMNAGAARANGAVLWFLHADTDPPADALALITATVKGRGWGRFDVRLSGVSRMLRIVEALMNWRSRFTGIATGDQALFVCRDWFAAAGGFPDIPLMEDIALSRALKRRGRPATLRAKVVTSSRRWERDGVWATILLMWRLRLAYFFGASPTRLAQRYRHG